MKNDNPFNAKMVTVLAIFRFDFLLTFFLFVISNFFAKIHLILFITNKFDFDILSKGKKMKLWQIIVALFGIAISVAATYLVWSKFKVEMEYNYNGLLLLIFQHIYYMVETILLLLIIIFGQKALEIWTKKRNVPWGGIICGVTWGIAHVISRGEVDIQLGLFATVSGFLFGAAYLLANRDFKKSWLILYLMFAF